MQEKGEREGKGVADSDTSSRKEEKRNRPHWWRGMKVGEKGRKDERGGGGGGGGGGKFIKEKDGVTRLTYPYSGPYTPGGKGMASASREKVHKVSTMS